MDHKPEINDFDAYLEGIGITLQDEQQVYISVTAEVAGQFGFYPSTEGIIIVHLNLDGTPMIAIDGMPYSELRHADGQLPTPGRRYSMRQNSGTDLFFPRRLKGLLESNGYVIVTEGAKKASVLSCLDFPCIGLIGWSAWRTTGTDDLHSDFNQIPILGRRFFLLPDFDGAFNADIHREVQKLSLALYAAGAMDVRLMKLPAISGEKMGIDDYLMSLTMEGTNVE